MTTLTFTPKEFDTAVDNVLLSYADQVLGHLPCLCKKKQHKNCPRHLAKGVMKMVYDQRQPMGDKLLYLQSKKVLDTEQAKQPAIILP